MALTVSAQARPWVAGALSGLAIGLLGVILALTRPVALERGELWTYDLRLRSAASTRRGTADIVLINVDELDITNVEDNLSLSWPWPRALFGYIATYCKRAGAKAIVFDWMFQDRGQFSVADAEEFAQALRDAGNTVIGLALTKQELVSERRGGAWAAELATYPTRAEAIGHALELGAWNVRTFLRGAGPTTLWYGGAASQAELRATWTRLVQPKNARDLLAPGVADDAEVPPPTMRALTGAELATEVRTTDLVVARDGLPDAGGAALPTKAGMDPPLAVLATAPARLGHVHQLIDVDGVMRSHAPLVRHAGKLFPSLPLAAYLVTHPGVTPTLDGDVMILGDHRFALDDRGGFPIRFVSPRSYRALSSYEILRSQALLDEGKPPSIPDAELRGAYVIVSATAHALRDLRSTPVSEEQLGAEVNANVLDNLEAGQVIRRAAPLTDGLVTLALCLLAGVVMTTVSRAIKRAIYALPLMLVAAAAITVGYVVVAGWALTRHDLWLAVTTPALASAIASFVTLIVLAAVERQNRRFVQEALGRYTSPALVRELIKHPEYLSLEWGEEHTMSVYFSDIAGFTTISEHLSAKQLVTLLNEYLTAMTDLVLEHGGVVDKYIGDAVMAFWGAPLASADHARRAVACAVAMRKRCAELRAGWKERFGHELHARAGVNTGLAVSGNMGSKHKYNYTVMGDMVNLASRLEGANKPYGTYLMISEATLHAVGDAFAVRELDVIAVKGKAQGVRVYEVIDVAADATAEAKALAVRFEEALAHYRALRFADARAIFTELVERHDDPPSRLYVERCTHFLTEPPPEGWDGVWHMKEK
jgi:adenylate cyclase